MGVTVAQGDIFWAELRKPVGSAPGYRRPVVIVQGDEFNRSRIATVVCVVLTSNLARDRVPGNVLLGAKHAGLPNDTVANVSQLVTLDRSDLEQRVGHVPRADLDRILGGVRLVLGM